MSYNTKTLQCGNCTIIVHRPDLTPAERKKREKEVLDTMGRVMPAYLKRKETQK